MGKKAWIFIIFVAVVLLAIVASWYFYKDTYYYNSAIKEGDSSICLKINDNFKISTCLGNIAANTKNVAACAGSPRLYIATCLSLFASRTELINNCPDISPEVDEFNCYMAFAKAKQNIAICDTLIGEKKDYCINSVAIAKNDVSVCDSLPTTSVYKETCVRDVAQQNP